MNSVSFQGFENKVLTFNVSEMLEPGTPVTVDMGKKAIACGSYDAPAGVVVSCDGTYAAVCVKGVVEMKTDGTLSTGFCRIVIDANGKASEGDEAAPFRLVLDISETDDTATVLF